MNTHVAVTQSRIAPAAPQVDPDRRPEARGKFLWVGDEKLWVKGVTYGTFAANEDGDLVPSRETVERDFAAMSEAGINALRVYTQPPAWLLDLAQRHGLRVMVGLPWEQHVAFLDDRQQADDILARMRRAIASIAGHKAILAYAIGNEIPSGVVRWLGKAGVERFLERLAEVVREVDPGALLTYVNYPSTEYLDLPFVDFVSFNVYLEDETPLRAYLARLQNIADEKPLVMAEIGLDSARNGKVRQGEMLAWQIAASFEMGCAGTFVFAWTDEWWRGGAAIEDWNFGLVTRDRSTKPALAAVAEAYADAPIAERDWPRVSVVLCSYNGEETIGEALTGLVALDYPDFEVIVIDDGSTDRTAEIVRRFDVRLISTPNHGLSHARNLGMRTATGEFVAYIDDDAWPDPHWLKFLVLAFMRSDHAAMGGPNIPPLKDTDTAHCVANAPGGPVHVLIDDERAEHIPGCNMSFRREKLLEIGGFDPQFRIAGDDVDCCWRIEDAGGTLGFCAAAMVWHHRRPSIARYFKQQRGYAKAEAMLAAKWPQKYSGGGHVDWHGRIYGRGLLQSLFSRQRLYHGEFGSAPFQSLYRPAEGLLAALPLMPEWFFLIGATLAIGLLGFDWPPMFSLLALGFTGLAISTIMAWRGARAARFPGVVRERSTAGLRCIVFWLHLRQPFERLLGRMWHGLGPWNRGNKRFLPVPWPHAYDMWSGKWRSTEDRLGMIRDHVRAQGYAVAAAGAFEQDDLVFCGSAFGGGRASGMVEEHGMNSQRFRFRTRPTANLVALGIGVALGTLAAIAANAGAMIASAGLALATLLIITCAWRGAATATHAFREAFAALEASELVAEDAKCTSG